MSNEKYESLLQEMSKIQENYMAIENDLSPKEKRNIQRKVQRIVPRKDREIYIVSFFLVLGFVSLFMLPIMYTQFKGLNYSLIQMQLVEVEIFTNPFDQLSFYQTQLFNYLDDFKKLFYLFYLLAGVSGILWIVLIVYLMRDRYAI